MFLLINFNFDYGSNALNPIAVFTERDKAEAHAQLLENEEAATDEREVMTLLWTEPEDQFPHYAYAATTYVNETYQILVINLDPEGAA